MIQSASASFLAKLYSMFLVCLHATWCVSMRAGHATRACYSYAGRPGFHCCAG